MRLVLDATRAPASRGVCTEITVLLRATVLGICVKGHPGTDSCLGTLGALDYAFDATDVNNRRGEGEKPNGVGETPKQVLVLTTLGKVHFVSGNEEESTLSLLGTAKT